MLLSSGPPSLPVLPFCLDLLFLFTLSPEILFDSLDLKLCLKYVVGKQIMYGLIVKMEETGDVWLGTTCFIGKQEKQSMQIMKTFGLSNHEIAERLFVSLNTIKTHSSKVFEKLDVSRRTQAVETAKRMGIIPL